MNEPLVGFRTATATATDTVAMHDRLARANALHRLLKISSTVVDKMESGYNTKIE